MSSAPEANTEVSSNVKVELRLLPLLMKFFKLSGAGLAVWLIGYIDFSFLWVIIGLVLFVSNEEYKKSKNNRRLYTQQATQNEKEAITARLSDLPSWVYFPDIERAEWLNKMVQQFWPFVGDYVKTLLTNTVGPQVEQSLPEKLRPFKFTEIDLGDLPPRIGGVKVYTENVKRDEIIMDMEILYASDSRFKVSMRGMSAGIKDFSLRADMRVMFNPLCNVIPLFGGLTFFFLRKPEIDFDLTDMANALDFPLLGNTVRSVIEDQISAMLVLPNRKVIPILQNVDFKKLAYPLPQGVLRIHAIGARELEKKDIGLLSKGKSDPFCEIEAGAQIFKTGVCENTIEPNWNEYFEAVLEHTHGQSVNIRCLDYDPTGENDSLGTTSIEIAEIMRQGHVDTWAALNKVKTGMLHMRYLWLYLSNNPTDLEKERSNRDRRKNSLTADALASSKSHKTRQDIGAIRFVSKLSETGALAHIKPKKLSSHKEGKKNEDMLSSAVLLVMLDSAKKLTSSKKITKEPSPRVKLTVGNESKMSMAKQKTGDPRWEQNFIFMLVDPRVQTLDVEVLDTAKDDKTIGTLSVPIRSLLDAHDLILERPYFLDVNGATSEMTVSLRLCLRILTSEKPPPEHRDDEEVKLKYTQDAASANKSTIAAPAANKTTATQPTQPLQQQQSTTSDAAQPNPIGIVEGNGNVGDASSNGSEVRRRSAASGGVVPSSKFGSINITLRYSSQRNRLVCVVHKCVKLIPCDSSNLADPYVRLYLLPERSNATKRKTQVQKDTVNPVFDETFDWAMTPQEFASKSIEVGVKNSVSLLSKQRENMGKVVINLSNYDITKPVTEWFDLQDPGED